MGSLNDNGKGNFCITYLFPSEDTIENINLEHKLKNAIGKILHENGIKKFVVADDEFINEKLLSRLENRFDSIFLQEKNKFVVKTHYDYDEVKYDSVYNFSSKEEALKFIKGERAKNLDGEEVFKSHYELVTEFFLKSDFDLKNID